MAQAREVALDHYDKVQSYVDGAALVAGQAWDQVDPDHLVDSWVQQLPSLTQAVAGAQYGAASLADGYVDDALEAQDLPPASVAPVDPAGFAGVASDGRGLASLMTNPVIQVLTSIPIPGVTVPQAMAAGRANLDMLVRTQVSDAGRLADQVSLTAHPAADGYTRIAVGGSCSRCLILAGKFYRWNTGFARHPWCDCKHVPTKEADAKGLIRDPYDIYRSMSAQERLRAGFTLGDQRALAEGADINQVVNARRGVYVAGGRSLTREGTTRRALFGGYEIDPETGRILARRAKGAAVKQRLTPDQIFAEAETRADALRMLHENGYLAERPSAALSEADRLRLATRDEQGQAILRGSPLAESPAPTGAAAAAEGTVTHIDDLPRLENPDDRLAVARGTNPRYAMAYEGPFTPDMAGTGVGYTQNCTRVAITYEMRRRGFAVTAGAGQTIGDTSAAYIRTFRLDGHYATRVAEDLSHKMTAREVAAEVESWPRGGRGIIVVQGHTLNVERDLRTGRAVFVDAQSARVKNPIMTVDGFEKRLRERGAPTDWVGVARVDDLELSDYGLRYVESPELSLADGHVGRTEWPTPEPGRMASFEEIARLTPDDTYGAALPARKAAPAKKATAPPAKKAPAAPKPPTLAALRKQVTDAGITIPAGAPRAVVENLVDALARGVAPARAREAAVRELTELRGMVGDKLAQTAAALENGASDRAMGFYARQLRRLSSGEGGLGYPSRAVPELGKPLQDLIAALERGDAATAKAALPKAVTGSKLKALGEPGAIVARSKLGSDLEWVGAGRGDVVEVLHPGYTSTLEGRMVTVTKPSIRAATPEQAQAFRAAQPVKAAKKAAAPKATVAMKASTPESYAQAQDRLSSLASRMDEATARQLEASQSQVVELTYPDGSRIIEKTYDPQITSVGGALRNADAEELAAQVTRSLGLHTPAVVRPEPGSTRLFMEYVEGRVPEDLTPATLGRVYESSDATLLGLADTLMQNPDRAGIGNWVLGSDGHIIPRDHGLAFSFRAPEFRSEFSRPFVDLAGEIRASNPMSPQDMAIVRARLEALRPEFERLDRLAWFDQMMARADALERGASGTGRIVPATKGSPAKAAPAKKAAAPRVPKPPEPTRMSLPALRTELDKVMERAGATTDLATVPKQALADMVTRARTLPASELKAEVGRWRQVVIDRRRDVADLLSQADQLLDAEATAAVLGQRGASIVRRWEQAAQGWPDLVEARKVVAAMQTGDPAKVRRAIAAARKKLGLEQIGADAGTVARYDAKAMTPIGGKIPADAHVVVVRPGYRMADGTVLSKPVVEEATAQEVAAAAKPVKAAKKAAAPKATTSAAFDRQAAAAATGQDALTAPKFRMTDPTDTTVRPSRPTNPEARAVYDAVRSYRRGASNRIGVLLRGGEIDPSQVAVTREAIAGIDKAMVGSALDRDVVVWRGQPGGFGLDLSRRDLAGFQWTDPAFVGTSAKRAAAQSFAEGGDAVLMRVVAPRGTRAVQLSGMDTEAEILLDRGLTYRVVADHGVVDGKRLLDVEILGGRQP